MLENKKLLDMAASYLPKSEIEMLTSSNINTFLDSKPGKPKVVLFTERKTAPFLLKAISHAFYDTMHVGMISNSETALVKRFKVTEFPSLILIRKKSEKPLFYKGALHFNNIFDFLNPYSEKFIFGDVREEMKKGEDKLTKPWLNEDIPELTKASANDVCYHTGKLCVIYVDTKEPSENVKDLLKSFKEKYAGDNKFSYMWLNAQAEPGFFKVFQINESELPKVVFLNVGSLKRALVHSGAINEASLGKTYDSIYNADARFKKLNGKNLPELVTREKKADL